MLTWKQNLDWQVNGIEIVVNRLNENGVNIKEKVNNGKLTCEQLDTFLHVDIQQAHLHLPSRHKLNLDPFRSFMNNFDPMIRKLLRQSQSCPRSHRQR